MSIERRIAGELRADGKRLTGYASVFNIEADIGPFREIVRPGAFSRSLVSGRDTIATIDHDPSRLIARMRSKTLTLSEDAHGLAFDLSLPDTSLGRDIAAMIARNDIGGMSFSFRATEERWPARDLRELVAVELYDIAIAQAFPAYPDTSVALRTRDRLHPGSGILRRRIRLALV